MCNEMSLKMANGNTYVGEIYNNVPNGYGKEITNEHGYLYEGNWKSGKYHGKGKLFFWNFGDVSYGISEFNGGFIVDRIDYYDIEDVHLGYTSYDKNGYMSYQDLNYSNGRKNIMGSFWYENDSNATLKYIICKCGHYNSKFVLDSKASFFSKAKYSFDCANCDIRTSYFEEGKIIK